MAERSRGTGWLCAALLLAGGGCGGGTESELPVRRETPQDRVLRIGQEWRALLSGRGSRSAESPVDRFVDRYEYVLELHPRLRRAKLRVAIEEGFEMRNGARFRCRSEAAVPIAIDYFWRGERAGIELRQQGVRLERRCDAGGFPEPVIELAGGSSRFTLNGDQLVPVAPPGERRVFIPSL